MNMTIRVSAETKFELRALAEQMLDDALRNDLPSGEYTEAPGWVKAEGHGSFSFEGTQDVARAEGILKKYVLVHQDDEGFSSGGNSDWPQEVLIELRDNESTYLSEYQDFINRGLEPDHMKISRAMYNIALIR